MNKNTLQESLSKVHSAAILAMPPGGQLFSVVQDKTRLTNANREPGDNGKNSNKIK